MPFLARVLTVSALLLRLLPATCGAQDSVIRRVTPQEAGPLTPVPVTAVGRMERSADGMYTYQWPGVYFLANFRGPALVFRAGLGKQNLHILVDGSPRTLLLPGDTSDLMLIPMPGDGSHSVRIDVVNENQDSPKSLGSFSVPAERNAAKRRSAGVVKTYAPRQFEFIGDSHTVGYGNMSPSSTCTQDEVWSTTDTTHSPGALVAAHYGADYQLNAISGRGVVRNYNGISGDTVPRAYPYTLLRKESTTRDASLFVDQSWKPSVIVLSLGTNDFSTELHRGESWPDRAALHTSFENTYVAFVRSLRAAHPQALIVLWATDMVHGEIADEGRRVADTLRHAGDSRVRFIDVTGLAFMGCHGHPTAADDQAIANRLIDVIDSAR